MLKALELDPKYTLARNNLNAIVKEKGNLDAALQSFQQVRKLDPNLAWAHYHLGCLLVDRKDYCRAIVYFKKALKCDPKNSRLHNDLATVRDTQALKQLPQVERTEWQALWADVDALLQQTKNQRGK